MKILYSGPFSEYNLVTNFTNKALISLGHELIDLNLNSYFDPKGQFFKKIQFHLLIGLDIEKYNHDIVSLAKANMPDLIFIDQAYYLYPNTVSLLREISNNLVHYTSEYLGFQKYIYRHFYKTINIYNAHIITNELNIQILNSNGAKKIIKTEFAYEPTFHHPVTLTTEDIKKYKSDVVFVGHWEPATEKIIHSIRQAGIEVKVWGPGWKKARTLNNRHSIQPIYGLGYLKALAISKICLGILSKWNHNQSMGRTFEIPAVESFLLAERTIEHQNYFEEGKEAEFFASIDELIKKIKYYLTHDQEREVIAKAGRNRCISSGYTYENRVKSWLKEII